MPFCNLFSPLPISPFSDSLICSLYYGEVCIFWNFILMLSYHKYYFYWLLSLSIRLLRFRPHFCMSIPFCCAAVFHNFFIHLHVDGHLGCLRFRVLQRKLTWIFVQVFVWTMLPFLLGKYLGMEWMSHMVIVFLTFL